MKPVSHMTSIVLTAALLAGTSELTAQVRDPHIGYIHPAGAKRGSTVQVCVGGQFLNGTRAATITGPGVSVKIIKYIKPFTRGVVNRIRQKVRELYKAKQLELRKKGKQSGKTPADRKRARRRLEADPALIMEAAQALKYKNFDVKEFFGYVKKLRDPKRQINPQLLERVIIEVTVDAKASPGERELRLISGLGVTNCLPFCIDAITEFQEKEPNDLKPQAIEGVRMPLIINGRILPGDVDKFTFTAKRGMRLVVSVKARALVPYLADAVPGWFQAVLSIYNEKGVRVAYVDDFKFDPDPVLFFRVPGDGKYLLEIRDSIYRGREDFVYRMTLGETPFISSIFPLGGKKGADTEINLRGWNLPKKKVTFHGAKKAKGHYKIHSNRGRLLSNSIPFALDDLPEATEVEPNNEKTAAQSLNLPIIVNGRIQKIGDVDVFKVKGRPGEEMVAEITARRLRSPLDSFLVVTDGSGKRIAYNDDHVDKGAGLTTHHADSCVFFKIPGNGECLLLLGDIQGKGGIDYAYRLRVTKRQPTFELRVVPANINAKPGMIVPITIHALRRDGFSGDITLSLKNAPWGFKLDAPWIPSGKDRIRTTLWIPPVPARKPIKLSLIGQSGSISVTAVPAEDQMQAFLWRYLVPVKEFLVSCRGRARYRPTLKRSGNGPAKIRSGCSTWIRFTGSKSSMLKKLEFELSQPPKGLTLVKTAIPSQGGIALKLKADGKTLKPGEKGNLIVNVFYTRTVKGRGPKGKRTKRRTFAGVLQAIPYEITPCRI